MPTVKTAISIEEGLLERIDALAAELELPRSRLLALAAEDYLRKRHDAQILARLNEVYGEPDAGEDDELRLHHRTRHRRLVEGGW